MNFDARDTRSRGDRLGDAFLLALLGGVLSLGIFFVLGTDPAVTTAEESQGLREELRNLRLVPSGEFLGLNDSSPYRWVLGPGFAPPEVDGTWVRSQSAQIIFYLPEDLTGSFSQLSLELSASPLLNDDQGSRSLLVRSTIDEVRVELPAGGSRIFVALDNNEEQVVEIVCDSLDSPAEKPSAIDARRLCVKFYAMAVWPELVER